MKSIFYFSIFIIILAIACCSDKHNTIRYVKDPPGKLKGFLFTEVGWPPTVSVDSFPFSLILEDYRYFYSYNLTPTDTAFLESDCLGRGRYNVTDNFEFIPDTAQLQPGCSLVSMINGHFNFQPFNDFWIMTKADFLNDVTFRLILYKVK